MQYDGSLKFDTKIDDSGFKKGLSKLGSVTQSAAKGFGVAITAVSTALAGIGAGAIKAGIEFESAFAGIRKTVDATEAQFKQLETGILSMSERIPQSAADLSAIGEAAGQLGIKTENIEGFIETIANVGVATNMSADEAATSFARLANITQMPQENIGRLASTVVALGNNLATTESEITAMAMRIAGAGNQVGMTEAQIMSFSGALSSVGIEAEAGGTAFSTLISKINLATATGGDELNDFAKVAGMSASEFKKSFQDDAAGAILAFIQGLKNISDSGGSAIATLDEIGLTDIRMRDAMLRAAGASDVFSNAIEIGNSAWEENTALTKEAEQRYKTMESRLQILRNSVQNIGIAFYKSTNNEIGSAVDAMSGYVSQLSDAFERGGLDGLVSKLGDVLSQMVSSVAKAAPQMVDAAVDMIQSFVSGITKNAKSIAKSAVTVVKSLVNGIVKLAPVVYDAGKELMSELVRSLIGDEAAEQISKAIDSVKNIFSNLFNAIGDTLTALSPLIETALTAVSWVANIVAKAVEGLTYAVSMFTETFNADTMQTETDQIASRVESLTEKIDDQKRSFDELRVAQQEKMDAGLAEIQYTERLAEELDTLVDVNGSVLDQNKSRVSYILNELNEAYGTEYSLVGNNISGYKDLQKEIENLVAKQKWQVVEEANLPLFEEAIKKEQEYRELQANTAIELEAIKNRRAEISKALVEDASKASNDLSRLSIVEIDRLHEEEAAAAAAEASITQKYNGANGDTELFNKSRNINGFRACRIANNLY